MLSIAGFQPGGGQLRSGIAFLQSDGSGRARAQVATVKSVDGALDWLRKMLGQADLDGLGVGAPLAWATGQGGLRQVDRWIRENHRQAGQVIRSPHVRSGAALVQGAALAIVCRKTWARVWLNEVQPKALLRFLEPGTSKKSWLHERFQPPLDLEFESPRERFALLSAWATFMGLTGRWSRDLAARADELVLPVGQVHLFWPESLGS